MDEQISAAGVNLCFFFLLSQNVQRLIKRSGLDIIIFVFDKFGINLTHYYFPSFSLIAARTLSGVIGSSVKRTPIAL